MYQAPTAPQRVGGVLDSGFALFRAALQDTFPLALLAALLSAPLNRLLQAGAAEPGAGERVGLVLLVSLVAVAIALMLYGAIISRIAAIQDGDRLPLGDALAVGLRRAPALLGAGILYTLAVMLGTLLLIVPGIYLMVALLFFYVPVIVESKGPIESLRYSRELVRGQWWRTAALMTIIGIVVGVLYVLLGIVVGIVVAMDAGDLIAEGRMPWYVDFIVMPLISGVIGPLGYALFMAVYGDLKLRREGGDLAERIAAVEA